MSDRDRMMLERILMYCGQAESFKKQYGGMKELSENISYQYCCLMCILQIGELCYNFSDEAKLRMRMIPWNIVTELRNILEREYGTVNWKNIWETITEDIPILEYICKKYQEVL